MPRVGSPSHETARPIVTAAEPFACQFHGERRGAAWVSARGELDLASAPQFRQTLEEALDHALPVIIDLTALTFIDSTGIHAIIDADGRAQRSGHRLVLIRGSEAVHRLFALTGLSDRLEVFDLVPSVASADTSRVVNLSAAAC